MDRFFVDKTQCAHHRPFPGVEMFTTTGERMTLSLVEMQPGASIPDHAHPHEQVGIALEGDAEFTIGDEVRTISPGAMWKIPGGVTLAYPVWGGWLLLAATGALLAAAVTRARRSGPFRWLDVLRGAGAGLLLLIGGAAILHLTPTPPATVSAGSPGGRCGRVSRSSKPPWAWRVWPASCW